MDLWLEQENWKQSRFDYEVGGQVYVDNHFLSADKLRPAWKGPFKILRVHANGTLMVERARSNT